MFSRLWGWVAAAFAALGAALLFVAGQRDRARDARDDARAKAKGESRARDVESGIRSAQERARKNAQQVREDHEARDSTDRPSGSLRRK